ncbi:hypothetical protein Tco_0174091 [Tanacetum coccineum]
MRTRSQARRRRQPQVRQTSVESSNLEKPDNPPIVTMADNRTMAQLLEAPTEGYEIDSLAGLSTRLSLRSSMLLLRFRTLPGNTVYQTQMKIEKVSLPRSGVTIQTEAVKLAAEELPPHLEYAFLEGDDKLPVIIAKDLKDEEKAALLKVLKSHSEPSLGNSPI